MEYTYITWLILGVFLVGIEIFIGFSLLFFLFLGIAAIAVGFFIYYDFVYTDAIVGQMVIWLTITVILFTTFYKSMKNSLAQRNNDGFQNIIGQKATTITDITKQNEGKVKWSGTEVRAILKESSPRDNIAANEVVEIVAINNNVFIVE